MGMLRCVRFWGMRYEAEVALCEQEMVAWIFEIWADCCVGLSWWGGYTQHLFLSVCFLFYKSDYGRVYDSVHSFEPFSIETLMGTGIFFCI